MVKSERAFFFLFYQSSWLAFQCFGVYSDSESTDKTAVRRDDTLNKRLASLYLMVLMDSGLPFSIFDF